ncbi:hypothetical protein MRS44_007887 [Fusarium solani]|uniref:uncharacterized protein n=1 Tax=Fusarium solani TaxID=169388 RepID=UPI0032C4AED0|nr:hypothetical protein MRS44_007887 [Fusarium solani]
MASEDFVVDDALVGKVTAYVEKYMSNYDASHDFNHIQRVLRLSLHIQSVTPEADRSLVTLAALLHDVGDKKYLRPGEDASRMISTLLVSFGAPAALADTVQAICLGVSYSSEVKDPARTRALVEKYPELAVVQDADRLDAIGAVGIARTFAFGGAKGRTLENTMDHFDEKLLLLEGMMKTDEGRRMARERTERLRLLKEWWEEETTGPVGAHIPYYRLTRAPIDVTAGIALPALKLREDSSKENSGIRWFYRPYTHTNIFYHLTNWWPHHDSTTSDTTPKYKIPAAAVTTMDTLPPEILLQILHHLPSPAVKHARLTSRTFNAILAKRTFEKLVSFLDPDVAQRTLATISRDPQRRRRRPSIWSPCCSVPKNLPIDEAFLMALWAGLRGDSWAVEGSRWGQVGY